MGCCHFWNYKHILQSSLDGQWIDGGKFPLALGSYATILKAAQGGNIDCTKSYFLDIVHVDIAFGDCVLVGGFCYSLILVDRATRYNWVYGLNDLSGDSIFSALHYRTSRLMPGLMLTASVWTVMPNYLANAFANTSLTMTPILWQLQPVVNRLMVWLNPTGKLWSICHMLISLKNKCRVPFGSSQLFIQLG
jgi:hypothetical protein